MAVSHSTNSLKMRVFNEPICMEIVRIVGYNGVLLSEFNAKGNDLITNFGRSQAMNAATTITRIDSTVDPPIVHLTDEVRRYAWPILGPDPKNPQWWAKTDDLFPERPSKPLRKKRS